MATIQTLRAREILDSRGTPTVEVEIETKNATATASVPSGASVGAHEAHELRDGDMSIHGGKGVSKAIAHVNETIASAVIGKETDQRRLDRFLCELDGTADKSRLGANAILGVSIAFARAQARENGTELYAYLGSLYDWSDFTLPQPLFNVLNGGKHARQGIDIQECMIAPIGFSTMKDRVHAADECVSVLKSLIEKKGYSTAMGDEGGFAPALTTNEEALDLLVSVIATTGYGERIKLALDVAASSWYANGIYTLKVGGEDVIIDRKYMLDWYSALAKRYPLISIEDGFAEDDWDGFAAMEKELGRTICIVGDDLTVTNVKRIELAAEKNAADACIIKPNQVGSVSESIEAVRTARSHGWKIFASHRSGETMDTFIADFAVGLSCDFIKAGAPTRPERMAKYTRLMEIDAKLHPL